jgi:hypothetical protein
MRIKPQPYPSGYGNEFRSLHGAIRFLLDKLDDDREMFESRTTLLASQQLSCLSRIDAVNDKMERLTRITSHVEQLIRARDERDIEQEWNLLANQVMDEYERKNSPEEVPTAAHRSATLSRNYNPKTVTKLVNNTYKRSTTKSHPLLPVTPTSLTADVTQRTPPVSLKSPPVSNNVTPARLPTSAINPYKRTAREITSITIRSNDAIVSQTMRSNPYNKRLNK